MTVDETHTIAAPGMGHEDLYVAMSRGADLNRVYVITDTHDDCLPRTGKPPTGRDVLDQILTTSHSELTATETWATYHPGVVTPVPALRQAHSRDRQLSPQVPDRPRRPQNALSRSTTPVFPTRDGRVIGR
jgi:hypothetical protein